MKLREKEVKFMNNKIYLSGMDFFAYHGCYPEEKIIGTRFSVDLVLTTDISFSDLQDNVKKTIDYRIVYQEVGFIMRQSVNLLETLAYRILQMIKEKFPEVVSAEVKVTKLNPTLGGKIDRVSVESSF